jgi:hypothetical protein
MMRVYLGLFFLNSLIGLKLVEFILVVVLNFFILCENLIKLNKFLIFFLNYFTKKLEFVKCRVIVLKISYH